MWALSKQIDELGGEWSFNLFPSRTSNFNFKDLPVEFYEPLGSFDRLILEALVYSRALDFGVDEYDAGALIVDYTAYPSLFNPIDGWIAMPSGNEQSIGRHVANVIAIADKDTLVVQHAWSGWTPDCTAKMSREFFDYHANGSLLMRRWDRGPTAETAKRLFETVNQDEFQNLWSQARAAPVILQIQTAFGLMNLTSYETWSLNNELPAEVLTLTNQNGVRIGVAILVHDDEITSIVDLFIWPPFRRRKLGSSLESFAEERAEVRGNLRIMAYVWEADSVTGFDRARSFLESCRFDVETSSGTEFVATAERVIE
jgi:GNAT superfamily N-acetyltransferase